MKLASETRSCLVIANFFFVSGRVTRIVGRDHLKCIGQQNSLWSDRVQSNSSHAAWRELELPVSQIFPKIPQTGHFERTLV